MKHASTLIAIIAAATLSTSAFAQRHDEKPHGMTKPTATTTAQGGSTGGRHDEGPTSHGKKKVTQKADQSKSAEKVESK